MYTEDYRGQLQYPGMYDTIPTCMLYNNILCNTFYKSAVPDRLIRGYRIRSVTTGVVK